MTRAYLAVALLLLTSCVSRPPAPASTATPPAAAVPKIVQGDVHPVTEERPVTDVYHGVSVVDPYRWLEGDDDPAVKRWSGAQNAYTRRVLDKLPDIAAIGARLEAVYENETPSYYDLKSAAGSWFVLLDTPHKQQSGLGVMPAGAELSALKVLVDPNLIDASGQTAVDWFVPSPDGKRVAVSLSKRGTSSGDVHVYDVTSGQALPDVVPRVNGGTVAGDVAWLADGSGFFYTRYPRPGERPAQDRPFYPQIYFHALGSDTQTDRYELGKDFPGSAQLQLDLDAASGRLLATIRKGYGAQFAHFLRERGGSWTQLSDFADQVVEIVFAPRERLLVVSRRDAPRGQVLITEERAPTIAHARVLVPQAPEALVTEFGARSLAVSDGRIYLTYQLGGPSEIRVFDLRGQALPFQAPLQVALVSGLARDGKGGIVFASESFLEPSAWYRYDEKTGMVSKTALAERSPITLAGATVARETATSKDGTLVPYHVLLPKDMKLDGSNACVASGYGGYGVNIGPHFRVEGALWVEQNVCCAVANLRGGSEFGDSWHDQGSLLNKQNVFDDFAAVLQALVQRGYTKPARLGIFGNGNGGLLVSAMLVQHPELFRALVSFTGMYDMLRAELLSKGEFIAAEFGAVQNPEQFQALYAYSPYHHVHEGIAYPAALLITGENDGQVWQKHTRKMVARLQIAAKGGVPILFRSNAAAVDGDDTALRQRLGFSVDTFAFLLSRLEVPFHPAAR